MNFCLFNVYIFPFLAKQGFPLHKAGQRVEFIPCYLILIYARVWCWNSPRHSSCFFVCRL